MLEMDRDDEMKKCHLSILSFPSSLGGSYLGEQSGLRIPSIRVSSGIFGSEVSPDVHLARRSPTTTTTHRGGL
ncbi:hypothetical protein EYF80_045601 [Liparis tanakae]|uniref:Uncharacterized protein n=1 Tax=Liparis tanakae TaxID=230148 RepID=A0A4Z2FSP8_9TELE|nr:hypothetical protein EYF80_045601 [Liparis tanakae]